MKTNQTFDCPYFDSGFCYMDIPPSPEVANTGACIGGDNCGFYQGLTATETDNPGFYDSPAFTDYPGEFDERI